MKYLALFLALLPLPALAGEAFNLNSDQTVYAFTDAEIPDELKKEDCDRYVFSDPDFTKLENGLYPVGDGSIIAEDNCLFTSSGVAELKNGGHVEFFATDSFNTKGNIAYKDGKRLESAALELANGQIVKISHGRVENYGNFDGETMEYENRD